MDNHIRQQNDSSKATPHYLMRKPSFRSEIQINFSESITHSSRLPLPNNTINQKTINTTNQSCSKEIKIACVPTERTFHFRPTSTSKPPVKRNNVTKPPLDSPKIGNVYLYQFSPSPSPTKSFVMNHQRAIQTPHLVGSKQQTLPNFLLVNDKLREFNRSSSLHTCSFLHPYPKSPPFVDNRTLIDPLPERSHDDISVSQVTLRKSTEMTKSIDQLYEKEVEQRRTESIKSCGKRHSFCAMESQSGDERISDKPKRNNLDTVSLKPGNSTLSISKPNWFVKKYVERQESKLSKISRKSVSCRDLGGVNCEGWLWKKQSGLKLTKWILWWCVLEKKELRFYKDKEDKVAEGSIYLPGMRVAPAPELKSKKFAFRAFHSGHTFYFCAEKREEMVKWMNKMGLASLSDFKVESSQLISGFQSETEYSGQHSCGSESDDSLNCRDSEYCSSPSLSAATSREDLNSLNRLSRSSDNIQGVGNSSQHTQYQLRFKLMNFNEMLKEKEEHLSIIDELLNDFPITAEMLHRFLEQHAKLLSAPTEERGTNNEIDTPEGLTKPQILVNTPSTGSCASSSHDGTFGLDETYEAEDTLASSNVD